nr:restriction endonuclease subunit S [Atlantibacter hermannii]
MEQVEVGKYQPYPEYKDSGVEWVGDMPHHWQTKPAFAAVMDQCIKNSDGAESNVLSLSYGNIVERDVENNFGLLPESFNTYQIVNPGDIVLRLTDLQNDKRSLRVARSTLRGIITSAYLKLACGDELDNRYAYRLLHSYDTTKVFYGMGGGLRQSMKFEDFRRLPFLLPPVEEQRTIAAFLDYETARIDKLIAQQQRLIDLLKEKRQAVISHAVTKGLNPDAPMKDSGVEWLGEVPEHWKKVTFKYLLAKTIDNRGRTPPVFDSGIPMLEAKQVDGETLFSSDDFYKFIDLHGHANFIRDDVQENDILFITVGTIGKTCLVPPNAEYVIVQNIVAFRCIQDEVEPSFLLFWLRSTSAKEAMISTNKDSILDSIKVSDFVQSRLFIPPTKEQKSIGQTLKLKLARMDSVSDKAQQAIQLMQERRTALISAAVTGKIDLRGWVAPTEEVSNG